MEVEDLGSETAFRATLDWFWRSRAACPGGRVGSLQILHVTPLSFSVLRTLPDGFSLGVRISESTAPRRRARVSIAPRRDRHRR